MIRPSTIVAFFGAALLGLMTYEVITLIVASIALAVAVVSLVMGMSHSRELRDMRKEQNTRAGTLLEDLEGEIGGGD